MLETLAGRKIPVTYGDWRPGDQPVFVSDNSKANALLGWKPQVDLQTGIRSLWDWVSGNAALFD